MGCCDIVGYRIIDNTQSFNAFLDSGATVGYRIVDITFSLFILFHPRQFKSYMAKTINSWYKSIVHDFKNGKPVI